MKFDINSEERAKESRKLVLEMNEFYDALEAGLNNEQKFLLKKYSRAYSEFMFRVYDRAYESGFADGKNQSEKSDLQN